MRICRQRRCARWVGKGRPQPEPDAAFAWQPRHHGRARTAFEAGRFSRFDGGVGRGRGADCPVADLTRILSSQGFTSAALRKSPNIVIGSNHIRQIIRLASAKSLNAGHIRIRNRKIIYRIDRSIPAACHCIRYKARSVAVR